MNGRYYEEYHQGGGPPPPQQRQPQAQYQQRPPPQNHIPPQQRRYDQRPLPQRAPYSAPQPDRRRPPPRQSQPQEWQQRDGSGNSVGAYGNDNQFANYEDRYYEGQFQHDQGYNQHAGQDYNYQDDRHFNYDERYRQNNQRPQAPPQQYQQDYHGDSTRNPYAHSADTRAKPADRERILRDKPESPKSVPWDNPFGAFPSKKPPSKTSESRSSEDVERARMSGSQIPPDARHSNSRPSTAHENRSQMSLQHHSAVSNPQRSHKSGGQQPDFSRDELPRHSAQRTQLEADRHYGPPQRAMTGPLPLNVNQQYDDRQGYGDPNPGMTRQHAYDGYLNHVTADQERHGDADGYRPGPPSRSQPQSPMRGEFQPADIPAPQDKRQNGLHLPHIERPNTSQHNSQELSIYPAQAMSPARETPNFDAIESNANEDQLVSNPPPQPQPVRPYRKPTYQNAAPTQQMAAGNHYGAQEALVSPLAEFSFDLPTTEKPQQPAQQRPSSNQMHNGYTQLTQHTTPVDHHSVSQYPPRSASRGDMRPPPRDPYKNPPPPMPQGHAGPAYAYGSGEQTQDRKQSYQQPGAPPPNGYNSYQEPVHSRPHFHTEPSRSGYDSRLQPDRTGTPASMPPCQDPPTRPATSNSMPAYPNGFDRRISSESHQCNTRSQIDPSARPVPFRPGLMQPSPAPTPVYQPPPQTQAPVSLPPETADQAPITLPELNRLRAACQSNPDNNAMLFTFAKRLVEAAKVLAPQIPDPKQMAKSRERYILDAHKTLKKLVQNGYTEAMFYLADCYGQGSLGLQPDAKEAFQLYQSAAKLGHAQAAYRVAVCCELGPEDGGGTRRDPLKAVQWYKRAASLGDAPAMYKMGMIQLKGLLGQPRNPREAISWLKRAAERADAENPHALHELALLYESAQSTDIVLRDEQYALQLFTQAADLGYKYSQFRLGSAYEYGKLGCAIDPRLSIAWYSKAAAQGEHQAEFALSGWYLTGSGPLGPGQPALLEQSDSEAYLWARKAAASGLAKAEYAMGYYTEVGIGVSPNVEEAKKWYFRATAQNHPKARERLEDLKRGGARMQKTRVSRSNVGKHNEGDCVVM